MKKKQLKMAGHQINFNVFASTEDTFKNNIRHTIHGHCVLPAELNNIRPNPVKREKLRQAGPNPVKQDQTPQAGPNPDKQDQPHQHLLNKGIPVTQAAWVGVDAKQGDQNKINKAKQGNPFLYYLHGWIA